MAKGKGMRGSEKGSTGYLDVITSGMSYEHFKGIFPKAKITPAGFADMKKNKNKYLGQGKAIGGPIENPLEKKQNPLYREELGMYGGGAVRKKMYARGGGTRPTRG